LLGQAVDEMHAATMLGESSGIPNDWYLGAGVVDLDSYSRRLAECPHGHGRANVTDDVGDEFAGEQFGDRAESVKFPRLESGAQERSRRRR
jgi:hypothetical protein